MFITLLASLASIFVIYALLPTLFYRYCVRPPFCAAKGEKKLLLSFDDGPDARYTEVLLELLKDNGVHAMFFTVAEKAANNPELIAHIRKDGHIIGLHSLSHRDAWKTSPAYQKREFSRSLEIMKGLGCEPKFYRAPWGHLNLYTLALAKKYGVKVLLWSVMAQDWEADSTAERVLARLRKRAKSGSVICLHDSGCGKAAAEDAPSHMLEALRTFLPEMLGEGWTFVLPELAREDVSGAKE